MMNGEIFDNGVGMDNAAFAVWLTGGRTPKNVRVKSNSLSSVDALSECKPQSIADNFGSDGFDSRIKHYYVADSGNMNRDLSGYYRKLMRSGDPQVNSMIAPHLWRHITIL